MLNFFESLAGVLRHGDIKIACGIVPIKFEAKVTGTRVVFRDGVASFKGSKEMVEIVL